MSDIYGFHVRNLDLSPLKKPFPPEKAEFKGDRFTGAIVPLTNVLIPWDMESTSKNLYFYSEFIIFHIAVALTIGSTFLIPLAPGLMTLTFSAIIMVFMGLAFLIGLRMLAVSGVAGIVTVGSNPSVRSLAPRF